jgi:hypothetical protein
MGLRHFLQAESRPEVLADVLTDMYEALEALARIVTGTNENLSKNSEEFFRKVGVSEPYKKLLKDYASYGNRFRHAAVPDKPKPTLSVHEVESFIYLTGVFIRLAITAPVTT